MYPEPSHVLHLPVQLVGHAQYTGRVQARADVYLHVCSGACPSEEGHTQQDTRRLLHRTRHTCCPGTQTGQKCEFYLK